MSVRTSTELADEIRAKRTQRTDLWTQIKARPDMPKIVPGEGYVISRDVMPALVALHDQLDDLDCEIDGLEREAIERFLYEHGAGE